MLPKCYLHFLLSPPILSLVPLPSFLSVPRLSWQHPVPAFPPTSRLPCPGFVARCSSTQPLDKEDPPGRTFLISPSPLPGRFPPHLWLWTSSTYWWYLNLLFQSTSLWSSSIPCSQVPSLNLHVASSQAAQTSPPNSTSSSCSSSSILSQPPSNCPISMVPVSPRSQVTNPGVLFPPPCTPQHSHLQSITKDCCLFLKYTWILHIPAHQPELPSSLLPGLLSSQNELTLPCCSVLQTHYLLILRNTNPWSPQGMKRLASLSPLLIVLSHTGFFPKEEGLGTQRSYLYLELFPTQSSCAGGFSSGSLRHHLQEAFPDPTCLFFPPLLFCNARSFLPGHLKQLYPYFCLSPTRTVSSLKVKTKDIWFNPLCPPPPQHMVYAG